MELFWTGGDGICGPGGVRGLDHSRESGRASHLVNVWALRTGAPDHISGIRGDRLGVALAPSTLGPVTSRSDGSCQQRDDAGLTILNHACTIASRLSPAGTLCRRWSAIASPLALGTSVLDALETIHRRGCFATECDRRAGATVLAALDTTGYPRL